MTPALSKRHFTLMAVSGAIPLTHLLDIGYSALSLELIGTTLAFIIAGGLLSLLTARTALYGLLLVFAVYWFMDVYFIGVPNGIVLAVIVICFFASMELKRVEDWLLPIIGVFAVFFSITSLLKPGPTIIAERETNIVAANTAAVPKPKNAVLHIILDEQMSPLAMPMTVNKGHPAEQILADYAKRGFVVNGRARTESLNTYRSVGAVMGRTMDVENFVNNGVGATYSYSVKEPILLQTLKERGYDVSILQTNFLDICLNEPLKACRTYTRANNMSMFEDFNLSVGRRINILWRGLTSEYTRKGHFAGVYVFQVLDRWWRLANNLPNDRDDFFSRPLLVIKMMDLLREEMATIQPGDVHIAHLMLPHFPYILKNDCTLKEASDWQNPDRYSSNPTLEPAYEAFWDQSVCTHKHMMEMIDVALDKKFVDVIVHGDHGARISLRHPAENDDDVNLTIHAARVGENAQGRIITENASLQRVFLDTFDQVLANGK